MDTPDKAAGFADSKIADTVNRKWLQTSIRDSRTCTDPADTWNTLSWPRYTTNKSNESTWLLRREDKNNNGKTSRLLYDNISFADSPLLSHSLKSQISFSSSTEVEKFDEEATSCSFCFLICLSRFRIFLALYVLLGITLAIYSRNVLSLASVGMVANIKVNRELVELLAQNSQVNSSSVREIESAFDGSCPLIRPRDLVQGDQRNAHLGKYLPVSFDAGRASRDELETAFKVSVKRRIEQGELIDWSPGEQGLIFAAGSVGNLLIAIPITRLGEIYGAKWIIFTALCSASIHAAFMPIISPCNIALVVLFQVIFNGLSFGADCAAYTMFAHWLTPSEVAFFVSCLLICYQFGTVISSFITAAILTRDWPWSWCFYAPAIMCAIWSLVWALIGSSEPSQSKLLSRKERNFLQRRSKIAQAAEENGHKSTGSGEISWLKLVRDPNIWAIIAVKFTLRWYFSVNISLMPTYLSSVAHMSVDTIGKIGVYQSLIGLLTGILVGYLTKKVVSQRPFNLSLATFRKLSQSIVNFGLAFCLLILITFDCNHWITIVSLTLGGVCVNFYVAAALQLPLDLSPSHCGLITSITNTLALGQALGAPISGLILNGAPRDRSSWRVVWIVAILLNTLSGLLFLLLVDSKPKDYEKEAKAPIETQADKTV